MFPSINNSAYFIIHDYSLRSLGQFMVLSTSCKVHFLPFRTVHDFERDQPLLALKVYQLASMVLADGYDR